MEQIKNIKIKFLIQFVFIILGAFLYTTSLKLFLLPKNIIDGGITGISFILSSFVNIPMGSFVFILNIPFLILGYKQLGKRFTIFTLITVSSISYILSVFTPEENITSDPLLSSIFGGIILGIGVGLIIKNGGSSDGTEIVAIYLDKKSGFSVGEIVMFFNIFILSSAGFVFGWDKAMYSLVAYFIASKVIDITVQGLNETKTVIIISTRYKEITKKLLEKSDKGITLLNSRGAYSNENIDVIFVVVSRLEIFNLKASIKSVDKNALVIMQDSDAYGKSF